MVSNHSTFYHSNHSSNIINIQNQSQKMRRIHAGLLGPLHLDMSRLVSSQPVGFTSRDFKGDSWYIAFVIKQFLNMFIHIYQHNTD
jgi:hypothetical protein